MMKLSEAILLGIGAVQDDKSVWLVMGSRGNCPRGCAIGTALYAIGSAGNGFISNGIESLEQQWPWTTRVCMGGVSVSRKISLRHYNGDSRECIAAWIATIEPSDRQEDGAIDSGVLPSKRPLPGTHKEPAAQQGSDAPAPHEVCNGI